MSSRVPLPRRVGERFEVFVNGVPQERDRDFRVERGTDGRVLVFDRELRKEDRLGAWRWFLGAWGIGTYRQNDSIDVRYEAAGAPRVIEGLDIEPSSTGSV